MFLIFKKLLKIFEIFLIEKFLGNFLYQIFKYIYILKNYYIWRDFLKVFSKYSNNKVSIRQAIGCGSFGSSIEE